MTIQTPELLDKRLRVQQISCQTFKKPDQLVKWMGAVQAQDFLYSLWAVGLRLQHAVESEVRQAIDEGTIIRTWPMRGTIHFVPSEDAAWMLKLLAKRVIKSNRSIYKTAGLDNEIIRKSKKVLTQALHETPLTRKELYAVLERAGVHANTKSQAGKRGFYIINRLALEGLICFGPYRGNQPTFVLLDEWASNPCTLEGDEALAELAKRYFRSHGPATEYDFAWWAGLTVSKARAGIKIIKSQLEEKTVGDSNYWFTQTEDLLIPKLEEPKVFLLPFLDEYTVGYKDRDELVSPDISEQLYEGNNQGILWPVIVIDGRVVGTWKRTFKKETVDVETTLYRDLTDDETDALKKEVERFGQFVEKSVDLLT